MKRYYLKLVCVPWGKCPHMRHIQHDCDNFEDFCLALSGKEYINEMGYFRPPDKRNTCDTDSPKCPLSKTPEDAKLLKMMGGKKKALLLKKLPNAK